MTQHTSGPWYYTKTPIAGFIVRSSSSKNDTGRDKFVADCGKVHFDPFSAEFEANAALIAAAPELLEALLIIVNEIVNFPGEFNADSEIVAIARTAIAKAERKA